MLGERPKQARWWRAVAGLVGAQVLVGCALVGTGGIGDRWGKQRNVLIAKELAWTQRPAGSKSSVAMPDISLSAGGMAPTQGGQTQFFVPKSMNADDITDFYLALFAKQGHKNLDVFCRAEAPESRTVGAAAWTGDYGYFVYNGFGRESETQPSFESKPHAKPTDPFIVRLYVAGNYKMPATTNEAPINDCPSYDLQRMTNVLKPYGLTPIRSPKGWLPGYSPGGGPFPRK
jgi:hypothetical protein